MNTQAHGRHASEPVEIQQHKSDKVA